MSLVILVERSSVCVVSDVLLGLVGLVGFDLG